MILFESKYLVICSLIIDSSTLQTVEVKEIGLSWSSHVHSIHSRANSTLGFLRRNLRRCPAKLKETAFITLVRSTLKYMQRPFGILIWPRIVTCWRSYSGVLRGLLKGIIQDNIQCVPDAA